jgi:FkbM family methyltransferase
MKLRSLALECIRKIVAYRGYEVRKSSGRYGEDVFADIDRLSSKWGHSIDVIFDVGANDGGIALQALNHFPEAHVFCFEPHPITFAKLKRQTESQNIQAVNFALGNAAGECDFFEHDLSTINSMVPDAPFAVAFGRKAKQIRVQCSTVDLFCAEHRIENIDILKVDTEGFDLAVLQGSKNLLKTGKIKFIYTEFNDLFPINKATGGALIPIAEFLQGYGYRFVASYNDYVLTGGEMFLVANALFALPPNQKVTRKPLC